MQKVKFLDLVITDIDYICPYYNCNCYETHCPFKKICDVDVELLSLLIHCRHPIQLVIPFFI